MNDFQTPPKSDVADPPQSEQSKLVIAAQLLKKESVREFALAAGLFVIAALAFYFSTRPAHQHFDYTARVALALLNGHVGIQNRPPSWLNEMVPFNGSYYSVFPLGAVLSVLPFAVLQKAGWIHAFPARALAAFIAGLCVFFFFRLSSLEGKSLSRRILLSLFPVFGTWLWCNLGFAGAWQLALGFAILGEAGALYFTLVRPRPLAAGAFFAVAFGNRTELILTLPVFLYFLSATPVSDNRPRVAKAKQWLRENWRPLTDFMLLPLTLGILTAGYNFARCGSFFDFGYAGSLACFANLGINMVVLAACHSMERAQNVVRGLRGPSHFPISQALSIWMLDLSQQSVSFPRFQRRRKTQTGMLACYRSAHVHPLDPWESGRLAILLPLRDYPAPVDVPVVSWQRPSEDLCNRSFTFCCFGRDQRDRYVAISLD